MQENGPSLVTGKLYLIPTTLGDTPPLEVLPISVKWTIENIDYFIVENEKTARHFIKKISPKKSQPSLTIHRLNKYTEPEEIPTFLDACIHGKDIGLLSEAGCPAIADPGAEVVRIAHEKRIRVVPLVGPSSILMALISSGMNGQNFAFNGYLPIDDAERRAAIKKMEKTSKTLNQSQIFIETPYRNDKLLNEFLKILGPNTRLCVATDITLESEMIVSKTVRELKGSKLDLNRRPSIFIIQA